MNDKSRHESTSSRLKWLMTHYDLRQIDIVNKCKPIADQYRVKIGRNDISQYVSGKFEPRQTKLYILAKALDVSEAWLMGYDVPMERTDDEKNDSGDSVGELAKYGIRPIKLKKFPMLGEIACGQPIFCNEEFETFAEASADIDADFCLTAKGDSMINARIFDGDIVFVKKAPIVNNGEIAAVIIDDEATLKRVYYYPDKNKLILNPENPKYEPLVYMNEELNHILILGRAVAFMSRVR